MVKNTKNIILKIILILGFLGVLTSAYLTYTHYMPSGGVVCDVDNVGSCSVVNTSEYSEIFGIPAGIWGIAWFIVLIGLAWKVMNKYNLLRELFSWNVIGGVFVIYFIFAEIKLLTICKYCTIVHGLVILSLILSFILYKKRKQNVY